VDLNLADVWGEVAGELRALRACGVGHLLTEDVVRFVAARALVNAGAEPASLRLEQPHPTLRGSRIDLVVGNDFVVEFKYPREPKEQNAAWTMALGEVLKDFYRLAVLPGDAHRLFVLVESNRLRDYIARSADRYGMHLDVDHVELHPDAARTLPATASAIIGSALAEHRITAHRSAALDIDADLRLLAYQVDPVDGATDTVIDEAVAEPEAAATPEPAPLTTSSARSGPSHAREGARREILAAIDALTARSGRPEFALADVVQEMRRHGTGYAESTIRTMVTSHLCANAPDHAGVTYDDLLRVDRGLYRRHLGHQ
jgi:hypothetical protein